MLHGSYIEGSIWAVLALIVGWAVARRMEPDLARFTPRLRTRWAVLILAAIGAVAHVLLWGSLDPVPIVHDEASYVLQARIFATGAWTVPAPPLPHFFEQFHVLVDPVLAPKYPPGHAILLVPGILLGLPGLVPVLLIGLTGGMLFALVRRLVDPWVALLAWFLWLIAPAGLAFRPGYFSEVTTGALMLLAWWSLLDWRESGRLRSLLVVSAAVGWSAITRPLTAFAFALPIVACVLLLAHSRKQWKSVLAGAALGVSILGLMPWHNLATTGEILLTPYRHYSEVYFPFDVPGFDTSTAPALRELPPDLVSFRQLYLPYHLAHRLEALPGILVERIRWILHTTWGSWWLVLGLLTIPALWRPRREVVFALVSAVLLVLAYLSFAHPAEWVLYYLEAQQIVIMLTAVGVARCVQLVLRFTRRGEALPGPGVSPRNGALVLALMIVMLPFALSHSEKLRQRHRHRAERLTSFRERVAELEGRSVVFVRYTPEHNIHLSFVSNVPDLERAHAWVVYDRGPENLELLERAGGRAPYLYDEETARLLPLDPLTGDARREE